MSPFDSSILHRLHQKCTEYPLHFWNRIHENGSQNRYRVVELLTCENCPTVPFHSCEKTPDCPFLFPALNICQKPKQFWKLISSVETGHYTDKRAALSPGSRFLRCTPHWCITYYAILAVAVVLEYKTIVGKGSKKSRRYTCASQYALRQKLYKTDFKMMYLHST